MEATPALIERHRSHHPPGSRVCVLGAVPVRLDTATPLAARYIQAKFDAHMARLADPDHVYVPRDFYSGNASLRAEVLRAAGGFDASFAAYGNEDVDLWLRLHAAGVNFRFDREALAHQHYGKELRRLAQDTVAKGTTVVMLGRAHPEAFDDLQLATPREHSLAWLCARALLLAITRRRPGVTGRVFALAALLERAGLSRSPLLYRAVLDYAFWAGVEDQLRPEDDGRLAELAEELHRGPFDLLLHR
jgi:hypothetical protein